MRLHSPFALALLLAGGLIAAGCGDGDTGTVATSPTVVETAAPTASEGGASPDHAAAASATAIPVPGTSTPAATPAATATTSAPPAIPVSTDPRPVVLVPHASGVAFDRPVEVFALPGEGALYVADQDGVLYRLDGAGREVAVDLRDRVHRGANEEGLLSVQPDPAFASNGHLWLYYSATQPARTVLSRIGRDGDGVFAPASELVVLEVQQPYANHNGGAIRFGPDGMLYLGLGDGGGGGDPRGNGQDPATLLGSIIRIDVRQASPASPYVVPVDNPLVGGTGVRAEVWAYGLRNPWRMEWDPATGALWVADVGQNAVEEVSIASPGANLGWNVMEGDRCFRATECAQAGLTLPVAVYTHQGGRCSVTGGSVVRGGNVPEVEGAYLFGDFCSGEIWALRADLQGAQVLVASGAGNIASIRQVGGEVYVLVFGQPLQRITSP